MSHTQMKVQLFTAIIVIPALKDFFVLLKQFVTSHFKLKRIVDLFNEMQPFYVLDRQTVKESVASRQA